MFFAELEPIFNNIGLKKDLTFEADLSEFEYNGTKPFTAPIRISGEIVNSTGIVSVKAKADFSLNLTCDRCAVGFDRSFSVPIEHILVNELNDEDNDDFIVVDSFHYDIEPLVCEDILLYLPTKVLCRESCAGICSRCGKDLNDGPCDCGREYDPRWDVLQQLQTD